MKKQFHELGSVRGRSNGSGSARNGPVGSNLFDFGAGIKSSLGGQINGAPIENNREGVGVK